MTDLLADQHPDTGDTLHGYLDAGSLGRRIVASLPTLFARSVSLHDRDGHCHWRSSSQHLSSELLGVRAALESFVGSVMPSRVDIHLRDGTSAVLLISRTGSGEFTGFVMLLVPTDRLRGKGRAAPDLPIPVMRAARHWGELATIHAAGLSAGAAELLDQAKAETQPTNREPAVEPPERAHVEDAVENFSIALHAQPLVPLNTEVRIRRYEVLLRDRLSDESGVAPLELLHNAAARGVASAMDRRVVATMLEWLTTHVAAWRDEPSQFSINVAPASLADRHFMEFVRTALASAALPPGLIAIEIDQGAALQDRRLTESVAALFDEMSVGLVIDNFTLRDNAVDLLALPALRLLKIDRQLTANLAESRLRQAMVAGIAQMARLAGVHSVAKQVDAPQENQLLAGLGLDFAQGYGGAAPLALDTLKQDIDSRVVIDTALRVDPSLPEFLRVRPALG